MKIIYAAILLALAGCQSHLSQYDESLNKQWEIVAEAQAQVDAEKSVCTNGKPMRSLPPKQYLKAVKCLNGLIEAKVLPVTPFPEPLKKWLYTNLENAALYSQGKIIAEQMEARSKMATAEWEAETNRLNNVIRQQYAAQDAEGRAKVAKALEGFEPVRPVYATCSGYGRTVNCRSY